MFSICTRLREPSLASMPEPEDHVPVLDGFDQTRVATGGAEINRRKASAHDFAAP